MMLSTKNDGLWIFKKIKVIILSGCPSFREGKVLLGGSDVLFATRTYNIIYLQLSDFIEDEFLKRQVDNIKTISDYITQLKNVGPGFGEFQFDKYLQDTEM